MCLNNAMLFACFQTNVCNSTEKKVAWIDNARKMAASGSEESCRMCEKKWHDDWARTGAGTSLVQPLNSLEEKALSIMGESLGVLI